MADWFRLESSRQHLCGPLIGIALRDMGNGCQGNAARHRSASPPPKGVARSAAVFRTPKIMLDEPIFKAYYFPMNDDFHDLYFLILCFIGSMAIVLVTGIYIEFVL